MIKCLYSSIQRSVKLFHIPVLDIVNSFRFSLELNVPRTPENTLQVETSLPKYSLSICLQTFSPARMLLCSVLQPGCVQRTICCFVEQTLLLHTSLRELDPVHRHMECVVLLSPCGPETATEHTQFRFFCQKEHNCSRLPGPLCLFLPVNDTQPQSRLTKMIKLAKNQRWVFFLSYFFYCLSSKSSSEQRPLNNKRMIHDQCSTFTHHPPFCPTVAAACDDIREALESPLTWRWWRCGWVELRR